MVALEWDRMDRMDRGDLEEPGSTRLHLYVSPEEMAPSGGRRGTRTNDRRNRGAGRRWKFAVRRALVVLVIASLGAMVWSVAERLVAVASTGGGSAAPCTAGPVACPGTQSYVATPGDTVWSIAVRFAHGGDPRPLADRLEAEIGGGVLQPGQRLAVP